MREVWEHDVSVEMVGADGFTAGGARGAVPSQRALFAARDLPAQYPLGVYMGVLLRTEEYEAKRARLGAGAMEYGVGVTNFLELDPTYDNGEPIVEPSCFVYNPLPLMNEDPTRRRTNVRMCFDDELKQPDCVVFVTTREVCEGEELLTYYGRSYDRSGYELST